MHPLDGPARQQVLQALLPEVDVAGSQAAYQLAGNEVGRAYASEDRCTALVVVGSSAWVYGVPRPEVEGVLVTERFVGLLVGADPSVDPRAAVPTAPPDRLRVRIVFEGSSVAPSPGVPSPLSVRPFTASDEALIHASPGRWVLELWRPAWTTPYALGMFATDGTIVSMGGPYALTDRYAEVAAWADPIAAGVGMVFAASHDLLAPMLDSGRRLSAVVLASNGPALRWAEAAGWRAVGEQLAVAVGQRRPGLNRLRG